MDDITRIGRYVRLRDPAVEAWRKVIEAGEDDDAYEAAIVEFEKVVPTTPRGVALKMKLEWQRMQSLLDDRLTPTGRQTMKAFRKTITDAIGHLAKQGRHAGYRW